jgi:hypothetical protein
MAIENKPNIKPEDELCRIRSLIEEQNKQINWGPIVAVLSVVLSAIIYIPNIGVFIGVMLLVLSFIIFLCRKKTGKHTELITNIAKAFIVASILLLILSISYDFYNLLRQPLLNGINR